MKYRTFIGIIVALFCIVLRLNVAYAYDDGTTHPGLTSEIVTFYNATHSGSPLTDEERGWLIVGSKAEDTAPRWVNHFYDPVHNEAWTGENEGNASSYAVMAFSRFGISQKDPMTAVSWVNADLQQGEYSRYGGDETWKKALDAFAKGDKKTAYIALGHVLHLAEDMAVPDHTRNDTHAAIAGIESDEASPLESYAMRFDEAGIKKLHIADKLIADKSSELSSATIEGHLTELAQYSNKYFFSKDTINSPKFENPKIIGNSGSYGVGIDEAGERFLLAYVDISANQGKTQYQRTYALKKINTPVLKAYFTRLSRQVVLHGAGIIDLFYKQAEDAKVALEFPTHIVQYDKSFGRMPTFSLLGEMAKVYNTAAQTWDNVAAKGRYLIEIISPRASKIVEVDITKKSNKEVSRAVMEEDNYEPEVAIVLDEERETRVAVIPATSTLIEVKKNDTAPVVSEVAVEVVSQPAVQPAVQVAVGGGGGGTTSVRVEPQPAVDTWKDARAEVTEIMYNPSGSDEKREWIEIYNTGSSSLAVSEMKFVEGKTHHAVVAGSSTAALAPHAYAVIAQDAAQFMGEYPSYAAPLFTAAFSLSNDSEALALKGGEHVLHEVVYASSSGAYGDGKSLQFTDGVWHAARPTPGEGPRGNEAPIVVVTYAPSDAQMGEVVQFDAASSTDNDGAIVLYTWDFGDGVSTSSTQATSSHAYIAPGNYEVKLGLNDNEGASSTRILTLVIAPKGARGARHVVISEIQVQGVDAGDEFIELYNPTDSSIDLSGWSTQYARGAASISTTTVAKKNFIEGSVLPARGFFLIARGKNAAGSDGYAGVRKADLLQRTLSMSGSESGGRVFLVAGQEKISSADDPAIVDDVDYAQLLPSSGKSIERKSWAASACASALRGAAGEFFGHGCDSDTIADFEVRDTPNPQNAENFPEPRTAPSVPQGVDGATNIGQYVRASVGISFAWQPLNDFRGSTSSVVYELFDMSSTTPLRILETTSTTYWIRIPQVGRTYSYALRALDAEGLYSATSTFAVSVPSYFSNLYFSQDTRASSSGQYLIDAYYDQYPFVPSQHGDFSASRMVIFYLNDDPTPQEWMQGQSADSFTSLTHALSVMYMPSGGGNRYYNSTKGVETPDGNTCPGYGPCSGQLAFSELEDMHITFPLASSTNDLALSPTDYVTAAFYDVNPNAGGITGNLYYTLVARDATHYAFGRTPKRAAPQLTGVMSVVHNKANSSIAVNWDSATDRDSLDKNIVYEINFSPLGSIDDARWTPVDTFGCYQYGNTPCRYARAVGIDDNYLVGVRAKDEFGNYSNILTSEWKRASSTIYISQTEANDWSSTFGYAFDEDRTVAASFQSFTPTEDFSFNTVGVKLWYAQQGDSAMLRLSAYPDNGSGKPDFINPLGQTTLGIFPTIDKEREHAFIFDAPIRVASSTRYWLVLDVASYSGAGFWNGSAWANAIQLGDIYQNGDAGRGFSQGRFAQCSTSCRFEGWYYDKGNADWYMRIGYRE